MPFGRHQNRQLHGDGAPAPPPVFGGYSVAGPGQFRLQGSGTAGLTYMLQTSTSLVDWLDHTNLVADPSGLIECVEDPDWADFGAKLEQVARLLEKVRARVGRA